MLTFATVAEATDLRQKEWDGNDQFSISYLGNALAGETGELCNIIKKIERDHLGLNRRRGKKFDVNAAKKMAEEELGDIISYVFIIARKLGIDAEKAFIDKFNLVSIDGDFITFIQRELTGHEYPHENVAVTKLTKTEEQAVS